MIGSDAYDDRKSFNSIIPLNSIQISRFSCYFLKCQKFGRIDFFVIQLLGDLTKDELEEKIDLSQMDLYMNFLRLKHPKHRSRYSDQAWLPQNKMADPILRELHER